MNLLEKDKLESQDQKDEPTVFLPSGVHTKPKLAFWLVLGFVFVVYSAGQRYRWLIFLVVPSALGGANTLFRKMVSTN